MCTEVLWCAPRVVSILSGGLDFPVVHSELTGTAGGVWSFSRLAQRFQGLPASGQRRQSLFLGGGGGWAGSFVTACLKVRGFFFVF